MFLKNEKKLIRGQSFICKICTIPFHSLLQTSLSNVRAVLQHVYISEKFANSYFRIIHKITKNNNNNSSNKFQDLRAAALTLHTAFQQHAGSLKVARRTSCKRGRLHTIHCRAKMNTPSAIYGNYEDDPQYFTFEVSWEVANKGKIFKIFATKCSQTQLFVIVYEGDLRCIIIILSHDCPLYYWYFLFSKSAVSKLAIKEYF